MVCILVSKGCLKLVVPVCNPKKLRDDGMPTLVKSSGISFMSKIILTIFEVLIRREFWCWCRCWFANVRAICIQDSQYDAVQWNSTSSSATRPSTQTNYWSNNPIKSFIGGWLCGSSWQASFWQGSGNWLQSLEPTNVEVYIHLLAHVHNRVLVMSRFDTFRLGVCGAALILLWWRVATSFSAPYVCMVGLGIFIYGRDGWCSSQRAIPNLII